jgi:hypothetical protein
VSIKRVNSNFGQDYGGHHSCVRDLDRTGKLGHPMYDFRLRGLFCEYLNLNGNEINADYTCNIRLETVFL